MEYVHHWVVDMVMRKDTNSGKDLRTVILLKVRNVKKKRNTGNL